jgi:hypothetical protein
MRVLQQHNHESRVEVATAVGGETTLRHRLETSGGATVTKQHPIPSPNLIPMVMIESLGRGVVLAGDTMMIIEQQRWTKGD